MQRFVWLAWDSLGGMIFAWPLSVPLAIWCGMGIAQCNRDGTLLSKRLFWMIPNALLPVVIIAWGTVFHHHRGVPFPRWHLEAIWYQFLLAFVFAGLAVAMTKGRRSIVIPASMLFLLFTFFCAFTSGSAVTDNWL